MRSMQRTLCAAMLSLQAVVLFLTTPVLISLNDASLGVGLGVGLGLCVACLLVAGMLRRPWAYTLGWAIQVAALLLGFVISAMFVLGLVFGGLWATAYLMGARIDEERAARAGQQPG